jgi:hypothetical protein
MTPERLVALVGKDEQITHLTVAGCKSNETRRTHGLTVEAIDQL